MSTVAELLNATRQERLRAGARASIPFAIGGFVVSLSFGVLARQIGLPAPAVIAMSWIVFAGSAQLAAISIIGSGGTLGAALLAAGLMNARFMAMGVAIAPSFPGGVLRRALQGQTLTDAGWAMARREDGSFDRWFLFGSTGVQYVTWGSGTVVGVLLGSALGDTNRFGLDAVFPAFYLALLFGEVQRGQSLAVAVLGGVVALALTPSTPAGVPILAAAGVAFLGLRGRKDA